MSHPICPALALPNMYGARELKAGTRLFANHCAAAIGFANAVPEAGGRSGGRWPAVWQAMVAILPPLNNMLTWRAGRFRFN